MTCRETQERFVDGLYKELDPDTQREFEKHLAVCENCSREYEKLKNALAIMDRRSRTEPGQAYWDRYWNTLSTKLAETKPEEAPPQTIHRSRPASLPAWAFGIAAMLLIAIGIYVGRTYFKPAHITDVAESVTPQPPVVQPSAVQAPDSSTVEALAYLERSKNVLIGLTNLDKEQHSTIDLTHQQQVSRELIQQGNILTVSLNKPDQQLLRQLVQDLQLILLQLANVEVAPGVPAVEIVQRGVDEKSILLKINLEQMKAAARNPSPESSGKKNTKSL